MCIHLIYHNIFCIGLPNEYLYGSFEQLVTVKGIVSTFLSSVVEFCSIKFIKES